MGKLNLRFWKIVPFRGALLSIVFSRFWNHVQLMVCGACLSDVLPQRLMLHSPMWSEILMLFLHRVMSWWLWLWFPIYLMSTTVGFWCLALCPLTRSFTLSITYWENFARLLNQELCGSVEDGFAGWRVGGTFFWNCRHMGLRYMPGKLEVSWVDFLQQTFLNESYRCTPCISSLLACAYTQLPEVS